MSALLSVENIVKVYRAHRQEVRAVDDISFEIEEGTTFGLVGESGSGKSTIARCALRLIPVNSGEIRFDGQRITRLGEKAMRPLRADMGVVFQNPLAALNPRLAVRDSIAEPILTHTPLRGRALAERIDGLLEDVGLDPSFGPRLPHQLSGGQSQRVGIARALATRPRLLVLDEPTSALDVSVQAQVLNLLQDLRAQFGLTYLMISHDLEVIRYMCDTAGVMRNGQLVESGLASQVLSQPVHEYTRQLIDAVPQAPAARDPHSDVSDQRRAKQ
ncbi:MAG: ATP-binding cassette domain-containing protein [Rhodoglobus sp.]|nr:ATP-binding cassette domain-containing protein [Rhodoglobus sp.]